MHEINLSVAGKANSGKTTLTRSLLNKEVGEVRDEAGITKESSIHKHPTATATNFEFNIIDTPGFENAQAIITAKKYVGDLDIFNDPDPDWALDLIALKSVMKSTIVLYLGSLEVSPTNDHRDEITLIKQYTNAPILGILTKEKATLRAFDNDQEAVDNRIRLWQNMCESSKCRDVIQLDGINDNPTSILNLFETIEKHLPDDEKKYFATAIANFWDDNQKAIDIATEMLATSIHTCQSFRKQKNNVPFRDKDSTITRYELELEQEVQTEDFYFRRKIESLFKLVSASHRINNFNNADVQDKTQNNFGFIVARIASDATTTAFTAGLLGIVIGFAIAGPPGALAGLAWGTGTGGGTAAIGSTVKNVRNTEKSCDIVVSLSNDNLDGIARSGASIIEIMSNQLRGAGENIQTSDFQKTFQRFFRERSESRDWKSADIQTKKQYITEILEENRVVAR